MGDNGAIRPNFSINGTKFQRGTQQGIDRRSITDPKQQSIFDRFDNNRDRILDMAELNTMYESISQATGRNSRLGKREAAQLLGGNENANRQDLTAFLNTVGNDSDNVLSARTNDGVTTVTYKPDGSGNQRVVKYTMTNDGQQVLQNETVTGENGYKLEKQYTDGTISTTTETKDGTTTVTEYNENGQVTKRTITKDDNTIQILEYNNGSKFASKITTTNPDGSQIISEYNSNGQETKSTTIATDNSRTELTFKNGKQDKIIRYSTNGERVSTTQFATKGDYQLETTTEAMQAEDNSTTLTGKTTVTVKDKDGNELYTVNYANFMDAQSLGTRRPSPQSITIGGKTIDMTNIDPYNAPKELLEVFKALGYEPKDANINAKLIPEATHSTQGIDQNVAYRFMNGGKNIFEQTFLEQRNQTGVHLEGMPAGWLANVNSQGRVTRIYHQNKPKDIFFPTYTNGQITGYKQNHYDSSGIRVGGEVYDVNGELSNFHINDKFNDDNFYQRQTRYDSNGNLEYYYIGEMKDGGFANYNTYSSQNALLHNSFENITIPGIGKYNYLIFSAAN